MGSITTTTTTEDHDTEEAIVLDAPHSDPAGPRVQLRDALEPDRLLLVTTTNGHTERLLPWFMEALEAGRFVIETGREEPHTLTFRREHGPAYGTDWRGERTWYGRGKWYVNAYVKGCGSNGSGTINLYLGKWRAPGERIRTRNGVATPPLVSPEGIWRALEMIEARIERDRARW